MKLYIRIVDGSPVEHPILEETLKLAYPRYNIEDPAYGFLPFVRVPPPILRVYETYDTSYELIDGAYRDVHTVRDMAPLEKATKQQQVKDAWANSHNFASWTFDETTCSYVPPVTYPTDGAQYQWDEASTSWIEVT